MDRRVVITGMGVVSSIGIGCDAYFDSLLRGHSGITSLANRTDGGPSPGPDEEMSGVWVGSPVLDFDPKQYFQNNNEWIDDNRFLKSLRVLEKDFSRRRKLERKQT